VKQNLPNIYTDKQITLWLGMRLIKEFYDRKGMHEKLDLLPLIEKDSFCGVNHYEIIERFIMSVILGANNCSAAAQLLALPNHQIPTFANGKGEYGC
jgi:hypothetical protein